MGKHSVSEKEVNHVTPSQVEHPWRAVARTAFQMIPALAVLVPLALVTFGVPVGVGVGAGVVTFCLALTKFMSMEPVNDFIDRFVPWLRAQ